MHNVRKILIGILVCLGLFAELAAAYNLNFLKHSPARHFSKDDWTLAKEAVDKALNETKDGVTVSWNNPQSNNSGSVTPIQTTSNAGLTCRKLQIENVAKQVSGGATYEFCQQADGTWALKQAVSKTAGDTDKSTPQPE